eukprot:TRINITY_DN18095_c0_g2_i1.p1 TRINITY_DN18095_c0_g2~~TRINITY_DN18095_c0_g2_i1.p1  ORF type:complete len:505 (+),score=64.53 TRINITY_DN18095_c0_g2_i1:542-2056(+)
MTNYYVSDEEYARRLQQQLEDEEMAKRLQTEFNAPGPLLPSDPPLGPLYPPGGSDYESFEGVLGRVSRMAKDEKVRHLAGNYGFHVVDLTWEDNARWKNSSWGPCISDMTLQVQGKNLPIIRSPNYEDLTWDVPIDKVPLLVGNEHGEPLRPVSLKDYLQNFRWNLHDPNSWAGDEVSLLAGRDSHVIYSAQSCFLPIPKLGGEVPFNVSIYNYKSRKGAPAVLAIVASSNGTSAMVLEGGKEKLYFNKNGERCHFMGTRLSQHRIEMGEEQNLGNPMSAKEKEQNVLMIIQVPLKVIHTPHYEKEFVLDDINIAFLPPAPMATNSMAMAPIRECWKRSVQREEVANDEDAIIKVGDSIGEFKEINNIKIERDPAYPIRVVLQFYKATSNGVIEETQIQQIFDQISGARKNATSIGSLVINKNSQRTTDIDTPSIPPWWSEFWLTYGPLFPQFQSSQNAAAYVFKGGRFANRSMNEVSSQIMDVLGNANTTPTTNTTPVTWGVL